MKRLIVGPNAVLEAARSHPRSISVVLAVPSSRGVKEIVKELNGRGIKIEERPARELSALAGEARHQGILAIAGEYRYRELDEWLNESVRLVVALDEITDPHNFGAIVRSAVAFGADGVLTLKDRAAPVTPVVVRASAGATEHAAIVRVTNLARSLATLRDEHDFEILGLAADGDVEVGSLTASATPRVLVVGSEGRGIRPLVRKQCTSIIQIGMSGPMESLNASVAAGIALHALRRERPRGRAGAPDRDERDPDPDEFPDADGEASNDEG